jgi:putative ABC transport system permease protein
MFTHYLKIACRNLFRNKLSPFINISGLAVGIGVAILIGLWVWDELGFDRFNKNYASIAQIARKEIDHGQAYIASDNNNMPLPLAGALKTAYQNYFQQVGIASQKEEHIILFNQHSFSATGSYVDQDFLNIFTLHLLEGNALGFQDPNKILLSESLARSLFGNTVATGKSVVMDGNQNLTVSGVYADLPRNTSFYGTSFLCPFSLMVMTNDYIKTNMNNWENSSFQIYVQLGDGQKMQEVSKAIKDVYWAKIKNEQPAGISNRVDIFLHPMTDWHLRSNWTNGIQAGGRIQQVWLFGIVGIFVLLLACINFMNLSTARSEKRAKEVGVRKTLGSARAQLINQFLSESLLLVGISFIAGIILVIESIGWFNQLADKEIQLPFTSPVFWGLSIVFIALTSLLAGSYPAFYLSSFNPLKVLKGTFRVGPRAAIPRRVMVVIQFSVSIMLVAGTAIVYRQVKYAEGRPIGYDKTGLLRIKMNTPDLFGKYDLLEQSLLSAGGVVSYAQASSPTTNIDYFDDRFEWTGQDPNQTKHAFGLLGVTPSFGKTVGWQFISGRDFSKDLATDSAAIVINQTAATYMGITSATGQIIRWNKRPFRLDGIIKDMITGSPYEPVQQTIFVLTRNIGPYILVKLNPDLSISASLAKIAPVFQKYNPTAPFDYQFVDQEFARKFASERRIGNLLTVFSILALFISCMGIFGLAAFVSEQRKREIRIRKVLGASVSGLWGLLSKEFVVLVTVSMALGIPVCYYFMNSWLTQFNYRTGIPWWLFAITGLGTLVITLLTISYQGLKAALMNPVKSLRSE